MEAAGVIRMRHGLAWGMCGLALTALAAWTLEPEAISTRLPAWVAAPPADSDASRAMPPAGLQADEQAALLLVLQDAEARGCDFLDAAHCLLPFPNNHFTRPVADSETGRQIALNPLAMPRNVVGRPMDVSDLNRADGFSPGQPVLVRVPGLSLEATGRQRPVPRLGRDGDVLAGLHPDAAILIYDVTAGQPHLIWSELDNQLTATTPCDTLGPGQSVTQLIEQPELEAVSVQLRQACRQAQDPLLAAAGPGSPAADRGPLLILRPAVNFEEGHRYIVALRDLRDATGALIPAPPGFRLCRDGQGAPGLSELPSAVRRCAALRETLTTLRRETGIDPATLHLAWDFTVASQRSLSGRLLAMRDQTLAPAGRERTPDVVIDSVEDIPHDPAADACGPEGPAANCLARIVRGRFTVPNFINQPLLETGQEAPDRQIGGRFWFDTPAPGLYAEPRPFPLQPTVQATFTCHIPRTTFGGTRALTSGVVSEAITPSRVSLYGHGLFGTQAEISQRQLRRFGHEHNYTFCATDWVGMSGDNDAINTIGWLADASLFPTLADRMQQGILHFVTLGRLLAAEDGLGRHPAFRSADGRPLLDTRSVFYDGNSQGGIAGGPVLAVSPDIHRAALGVPGMNYSTLLQRSIDFDPYGRLFYVAYPDTIDQQLVFGFIQMLWDRAENNGYAQHLGDGEASRLRVAGREHRIGLPNRTLPGLDGRPLPRKQALLQVAFADHQVSMISADVMARTLGVDGVDAAFRAPAACASGQALFCFDRREDFLARRHPDARPLAGLMFHDSDSYRQLRRIDGSALMLIDEGLTATPPVDNRPPRDDDFDPHGYPRNTVMARCQKARFLRSDGRVIALADLQDPAACPMRDGSGRPFKGDAEALPALR